MKKIMIAMAGLVLVTTSMYVCIKKSKGTPADPAELTICSYNIQNFGSPAHYDDISKGTKRTNDDLINISDYIAVLNCDLMALQEISPVGDETGDGEPDWETLLKRLKKKGYEGVVSDKQGDSNLDQRPAIIFKADKLKLISSEAMTNFQTVEIDDPGCDKKYSQKPEAFKRHPLKAYFRAENGFDFRVIVVHLKASRDCEMVRSHETTELNAWVEEYLKDQKNDPDMIIIGDFNFAWSDKHHKPRPPTVDNMLKGDYLTLVSGKKQVSSNISASYFDQAFVTRSLQPYLVPDSWHSDVKKYKQNKIVSDHFPVMFQLGIGQTGPR